MKDQENQTVCDKKYLAFSSYNIQIMCEIKVLMTNAAVRKDILACKLITNIFEKTDSLNDNICQVWLRHVVPLPKNCILRD